MGAISADASIPVLREYLDDPNRAVRETCEIALAKIEWDHSEEGKRHHAGSSSLKSEGEIQCVLSLALICKVLSYSDEDV